MSLHGGKALAITHGGGLRALLSPDGRLLFVQPGKAGGGIVVLPTNLLDVEHLSQGAADSQSSPILVDELPAGAVGNWFPSSAGVLFLSPRPGTRSYTISNYSLKDRKGHFIGNIEATVGEVPRNFTTNPEGSVLYWRRENTFTQISLLQRNAQ